MKRIIPFLFFGIFGAGAMAASYSGSNGSAQKPCQITEQAMQYELSRIGRQRTVEDHVKTARIYKEMSYRGCGENSKKYVGMSNASIQSARGLLEISDYDSRTKLHYDSMINNARIKSY